MILNSEIGTTDCTEYTENEGIMKKHSVTLKLICPWFIIFLSRMMV